jgi:Mg-chelatase subunit ChlD
MPASWHLDLSDPWALLLLTGVPVLCWYFRRSLVDFSRSQRILSLVCRSLILLLLVAAVCGLSISWPGQQTYVVFLLDRSRSVGEPAWKTGEQFLDQALAQRGRTRVAFLTFDSVPGKLRTDRPTGGHTVDLEESDLGTDIAAVLEAAVRSTPPGYVPQIVLLSDGNQTSGDALQTAVRLGVPIFTVPLPPSEEPEVQLAEILLPPQVRPGETFNVEVIVASNHEDEATLTVWKGRDKLDGVENVRRKLKKGDNRFLFPQRLDDQEKFAIYRAEVRATQDTLAENNRGHGLVCCTGKPRVLLIDSEPEKAKPLKEALEGQGILVEDRPDHAIPETLYDLQQYDLLILSNVAATRMKQQQQVLIRRYVQDLGGGLLLLGGDQSFGLGGYSKSELRDLLPVHCDFEHKKEKPTLAIVLVIDRSGSMQEDQKLEMAKQAACGVVDVLGPQDRIGVIAFDDNPQWACEIMSAADKGTVTGHIQGIEIGGGTAIYPAINAAFQSLRDLGGQAKYKHVIVLTDGVDEPAIGADHYRALIPQMREANITVSTVAIGRDADKSLLEEVARLGGGRYYPTEEPSSVPQILVKEAMEASKQAIMEGSFFPQLARSTQVLANLDIRNAPPLQAYVKTRAKETSELILVSDRFDPILAWMRVGLGMSVAFTSNARLEWADEWITNQSEFYRRFWAQVVRHAMRKNDLRGVQIKTERHGRKAKLIVDAVDPTGRFLNEADVDVRIIRMRSEPDALPLLQTAPGRYQVEFDTAQEDDYFLQVTGKKDGQPRFQQAVGLAIGCQEELRLRPLHETLLRQLAEQTGGKYQPLPEEVFRSGDRYAQQTMPLWPWLVLAAVVLFVLDVALRRLDLRRRWLRSR